MILRITLLFSVFLFVGCPIPTIPHGNGVVLDNDTFESFQPGEATRADILLNFGEPRYRHEDDQYLIYEWRMTYGYVIIASPAGALPPIPVSWPHYLCLELGPDSYIVRREHLIGSLFRDANEAIQVCTNSKEEDNESRQEND